MSVRESPKTHFRIEAECLNCLWSGRAKAEKGDHFLHWKCPRCGSRYCVTKPRRFEENGKPFVEGQRTSRDGQGSSQL